MPSYREYRRPWNVTAVMVNLLAYALWLTAFWPLWSHAPWYRGIALVVVGLRFADLMSGPLKKPREPVY